MALTDANSKVKSRENRLNWQMAKGYFWLSSQIAPSIGDFVIGLAIKRNCCLWGFTLATARKKCDEASADTGRCHFDQLSTELINTRASF